EYSDNSGKTILKKSFNTTYNADDSVLEEQELLTYYVYDKFERLIYVLPPLAMDAIGTTESFAYIDYHELVYYYEYDKKGRMISKQIPGAAIVEMVYDRRDNLVLTQDGNLRSQNKWLFYKYDKFSRPIMTGLLFDDREPMAIRYDFSCDGTEIDDDVAPDELPTLPLPHPIILALWENRISSDIGYTLNRSFTEETMITEDDILTITYYDDYDFLQLDAFPYLIFDDTDNSIDTYNDDIDGTVNGYYDRVKGQLTGTVVKVLDGTEYTASANKIFTTHYYDDKGRLIQSIEQGYDNCETFISNRYNFAGKLKMTRQTHNAYGKEYTIDNYMDYDHAGRLEIVEQEMSGEIVKSLQVIAEMQYNETGQLISKKLHEGLQDINYDYNIRGWLSQINDPMNLGGDLFGMKLLYNDISEKDDLDGIEQYNGNISGMIWNSQSIAIEPVRAYGFTYDAVNRLTAADYGEFDATWDDFPDKYNVPGISYDKNGNILSLVRHGETGVIDNLTYGYKDANKSNKLYFVNDLAGNNGFSDGNTGTKEYAYDSNGNMRTDLNKGLSNIQYNILNLPESLEKGTDVIEYIYDATGRKLVNNLPSGKSYVYLNNFVYNETNDLEYILTDEGRIYVDGTNALYEYYLTDHLGNTRVVFDETGATPAQTSHYYPFGMRFNNASIGNPSNKYLYNGKEIQEETDWYDYGARMYDAAIARWHVVDPMAERRIEWSSYTYVLNNPISLYDPNGLTDYSFNQWTGKFTRVGEEDDDPDKKDRIVKVHKMGRNKGNVKKKKK
ncbi:RHS repeat domain-containing protein, partial [Bacteroidota bacterium]